jgi:hypothetical protein
MLQRDEQFCSTLTPLLLKAQSLLNVQDTRHALNRQFRLRFEMSELSAASHRRVDTTPAAREASGGGRILDRLKAFRCKHAEVHEPRIESKAQRRRAVQVETSWMSCCTYHLRFSIRVTKSPWMWREVTAQKTLIWILTTVKKISLFRSSAYGPCWLGRKFTWRQNSTQAKQHILLATATASIIRHSICRPFTLFAQEPQFSVNWSTPALQTSRPIHSKSFHSQKSDSCGISRMHSSFHLGCGLISAHRTSREIYNCLLSPLSYRRPKLYIQSSLLARFTKWRRMPYVEIMSVCLSTALAHIFVPLDRYS